MGMALLPQWGHTGAGGEAH